MPAPDLFYLYIFILFIWVEERNLILWLTPQTPDCRDWDRPELGAKNSTQSSVWVAGRGWVALEPPLPLSGVCIHRELTLGTELQAEHRNHNYCIKCPPPCCSFQPQPIIVDEIMITIIILFNVLITHFNLSSRLFFLCCFNCVWVDFLLCRELPLFSITFSADFW